MQQRFAVPVLLAGIFMLSITGAHARVQAGVLECRSGKSVGFIIGSVRRFACVFKPAGGGPVHVYRATARRYGLDVGVTNASLLEWAVLAPTAYVGPGDLAGRYAGASGSIAVGAGLGANALVGGSRNGFALQPLSVEAQRGFNVSLGAEGFRLSFVR